MHRRSRRAAVIAALASAALVFAAVPTAQAGDSVTVLHTTLTGAEEAPVTGDEDGRGAFAAVIKGDTLCYVLVATGIDTAAAAHIHVAPVGVAGPVVVPLDPPNRVAKDCVTVDGELLAAIVASPADYYVNVHNADFPGGAIRGQLG
jgi:hypothetical protein